MTEVSWGIVGFGWVARDFMAPAIAAAGHRLVAVCDPDPAAAQAAAGLGVPAHAGLGPFLLTPGLDAVYVATPNHRHREPVLAAAAAGKAVLCEKPMAASLGDAEAMARAVAAAGILYGTAFDQRHHPAHAAMRAAIRAGRIGTVTAVRIVYACWLDRGFSPVQGHDNWRIDGARAGGGALMDLAPHGLDLVDFLLDEPLAGVAALTQSRVQDYAVDDGALVIGRTAGGVLASLHVAYNHPDDLPRRRLEVVGTQGLLVATDTMGQDPGGALTLLRPGGGAERLPFDPALSPFTAQVAAFGTALRDPGGRGGYSAARDLHTMRLLAEAYGAPEHRRARVA